LYLARPCKHVNSNMDVKEINLTPAELQAILEHRRVMSLAQGREISLEQATEDFIKHCRLDWLREKQRRDNLDQIQEIERHKYFRSIEEHRDIGRRTAAEEWCSKYAYVWREARESLVRNGFLQAVVALEGDKAVHLQPAATLAGIAQKYNCEVYIHHGRMDCYNFILQGKKYMSVKSVMGVILLSAIRGESIEIISAGPDAKDALIEIAKYIDKGFEAQDVEGVAGIDQ